MARRLVSGAKEAMAGLRIAPTEYEKIGSDAAIQSQKERAGHDARLIAQPTYPQGGEGQGWASGFDIANHRPDGKTPTKTIGSLQGRGRSTVAVM